MMPNFNLHQLPKPGSLGANIITPALPIQSLPISQLITRVNAEKPPEYIYRGLVYPSIGVIYGPAKSGKTVFAEGLLMHLAAGATSYLGDKLYVPNPRVLMIGMEEYYPIRTIRNRNQVEYMTAKLGLDPSWADNFHVVDDRFPRHFHGEQEWDTLKAEIDRLRPSVVVLDSLTRLSTDPIEESTVAQKLMERLRNLAYSREITLIIIHHAHKIEDRPLAMANMAGSRVIAQEVDFMIGINRISNGTRYLKDIAYRYAPDDSTDVLTFNINDSQVIEAGDYHTERELLKDADPNASTINIKLVLEHFVEATQNDTSVQVNIHDLCQKFVTSGSMSKVTLHDCLNKLISKNQVHRSGKGLYRILLPS